MPSFRYDGPSEPAAAAEETARRFRIFAQTEAEETSPLYYHLALAIAEDSDLPALAASSRSGQPPANMLLAAVHYLLLRGANHRLAGYYRSLTEQPLPPGEAFPVFRAFCIEQQAAIQHLLATRAVQTNEVARCAYLLPALACAAELAEGRPLALIEIGASAGLNLMADQYRYLYRVAGGWIAAGAVNSPVQITTELHWRLPAAQVDHPAQALLPSSADLSLVTPVVQQRIGIDLHVVNLADDDAYLWLRALIWPEHEDRVQRLAQARQVWLAQPPQLVEGDAVSQLPALLETLPMTAAPVLLHTHVLNQFSPPAAAALEAAIAAASRQRPIYRIGNDLGGGSGKQYVLRLRRYWQGAWQERVLALVDGHARRIEWLAASRLDNH
jgi:hypothetical protein